MERGHATAGMAGDFARRAGAKRLLLTHFSPSFGFHPVDASIHHLGIKEVRAVLAAGSGGRPAVSAQASSTGAARADGAAGAGSGDGGGYINGAGAERHGRWGSGETGRSRSPAPAPAGTGKHARSSSPPGVARPGRDGGVRGGSWTTRSFATSSQVLVSAPSRPCYAALPPLTSAAGAGGGVESGAGEGWNDSDDMAFDVSGAGSSGRDGSMDYPSYSTHLGSGGGSAGASAGGLHPWELGVLETAREDADGRAVTVSVAENMAAARRQLSSPSASLRWTTVPLTAFSHPAVQDTPTMMGPTAAAQRAFGRREVLCARDFMAIPIPPPIPPPVTAAVAPPAKPPAPAPASASPARAADATGARRAWTREGGGGRRS